MKDRPMVACAAEDDPSRGSPAEVSGDAKRGVASWLPRCSGCGRWIAPPGGAAFGEGRTWCEPCAVRIDLSRGEGRTR